jgi:hypothetical protein
VDSADANPAMAPRRVSPPAGDAAVIAPPTSQTPGQLAPVSRHHERYRYRRVASGLQAPMALR